jgi:hypothetical protein
MAKTIKEAIELNQKTFNKKTIYYPSTYMSFGKYKDLAIYHIAEHDKNYLNYIFNVTPCYVTDEVTKLLK